MKTIFKQTKKRALSIASPNPKQLKKPRRSPGAPKKLISSLAPALNTPMWRLAKAMSIYRRFSPGLGHDGDGLYGALTNQSLKKLMVSLDMENTRIVDIGAADGKVLLAGLACGAVSAHGVEVCGDCLEDKFDSMIRLLKRDKVLSTAQVARLKCKVNVAELPEECGSTVEGMLAHYFPEEYTTDETNSDEPELIVIAVWHGFNVAAKQALLRLLCKSTVVSRFVVVGPQNFPYGKSDEILEFMKEENCQWQPKALQSIIVKLSGGGETYRANVIGK
jgi:hypothetical protein